MKWGTPYFISLQAAYVYYAQQGTNKEAVDLKLEQRQIHIGKPPLKDGDTLEVDKKEGRYFINDGRA